MPERKGYRSDRLRRRRRSKVERSQAWLLYVLAGGRRVRGRARRVVRRRQVRRRGGARQEGRLPGGHPAHRARRGGARGRPARGPGPRGRRPRRLSRPAGPAAGGTQRRVRVRRRRHGAGASSRRTSGASSTRPSTRCTRSPCPSWGSGRGPASCRSSSRSPWRWRSTATTRMIEDGDLVPVADLPAIFSDGGENRRDLTDPAGRPGRGDAGRGGPAARRGPRPPRRPQPVTVGGAGPRRRARAHHVGRRRGGAVPLGHACRRGAVRLRALSRGRSWPASRGVRRRTTPTSPWRS